MKNRSKQHYAFHWIKNEKGAAAIVVTIIMLAIAVLIVSTSALIGLDDLDMGYGSSVSNDAVLSAESCVEEAITQLTRNSGYTGSTLDIGDATCIVTVTGVPCGSCTITAESTMGQYERKIQAEVTLSGSTVDITSWLEID